MSTSLSRNGVTSKSHAEDDLPIFLQPDSDVTHVAVKQSEVGLSDLSLQSGVPVNAPHSPAPPIVPLASSASATGARLPRVEQDASTLQWLNQSPETTPCAPPPVRTALLNEAFQWADEAHEPRAVNSLASPILSNRDMQSGKGELGQRTSEPCDVYGKQGVPLCTVTPQSPFTTTTTTGESDVDLCLRGETGRRWCLRRQRVLGKGSYGCATLYRCLEEDNMNDTEGTMASMQAHTSTLSSKPSTTITPSTNETNDYVVVKSIDEQTMSDRVKELAGLEMELCTLRRCAGHPHMVQFVDYCLQHTAAATMQAFSSLASPRDKGISSSSLVIAVGPQVRYIVMEYCGGGDLGAYMEAFQQRQASASPLSAAAASGLGSRNNNNNDSSCSPNDNRTRQAYVPEAFVASMLIQLFVGLHFLHAELHVLHRDIKAQNLFLLADGATMRIGDFGIAAELPSLSATLRESCGTPFYMAPELCKEEAYGLPVDVWAAGVVLYELMCGTKPFQAATTQALLRRVTTAHGVYGTAVCLTDDEEVGLSHHNDDSNSEEGGSRRALAAHYSKPLRALVQSFFTINPVARPTVRQVLRSAYVRQNLRHVPPSALRSPYYVKIFGEDVMRGVLGTLPPQPRVPCHTNVLQQDKARAAVSSNTSAKSTGLPVVTQPAEPPASLDEARWNDMYADDDFESDSDA